MDRESKQWTVFDNHEGGAKSERGRHGDRAMVGILDELLTDPTDFSTTLTDHVDGRSANTYIPRVYNPI